MNINNLMPQNSILHDNVRCEISKQLNYNQYMIFKNNEHIVVNIKEIKLIKLSVEEVTKLGYKVDIDNNTYNKNIILDDIEQEVILNINHKDDLTYEDVVGIRSIVPDKYTYVHQVENLETYLENKFT